MGWPLGNHWSLQQEHLQCIMKAHVGLPWVGTGKGVPVSFSISLAMKHGTRRVGIRWRRRVKEFSLEDGGEGFERSQRLEIGRVG